MLRFCNGPQIAAPYKSIGKIFAENSFDAKGVEGQLFVLDMFEEGRLRLGLRESYIDGQR